MALAIEIEIEIEIQWQFALEPNSNNPTLINKQRYILHQIQSSSPTPTRSPSPLSLHLPALHNSLLNHLSVGVKRAGSCRRRGCKG